MLANRGGAVVAHQEDQRIVPLTLRFQQGQRVSDCRVDPMQGTHDFRCIGRGLVGIAVDRGKLCKEKAPVGVAFDPVEQALRHHAVGWLVPEQVVRQGAPELARTLGRIRSGVSPRVIIVKKAALSGTSWKMVRMSGAMSASSMPAW